MRVLVTNSEEPQAYTIVRSLRAHAQRVVVTSGGRSIVTGRPSGMTARSRFVDARHEVPPCGEDWLAGRLQAGNSPTEERYVRRIEEICDLERIDVIFPSLDPEVYVLSKNKARLAQRGVVVVVPDPEQLRVPLDKAATTRAALRSGFPVPQTWYPRELADLDQIVAQSRPPWIVKPRHSAHGLRMALVESLDQLPRTWLEAHRWQPEPIVQEYLPGGLRCNYYVIMGRDGRLLSALTPRVRQTHRSGFKVSSKSAVSAQDGTHLAELEALLGGLGLWGAYTVQTQIDPRDGRPRLLEINARLGHHLWWRTELGVNEPLLCVQLARGQRPTGVRPYPAGVLLLDPLHDLSLIADRALDAALRLGSPQPAERDGNPGLRDALRDFRRLYLNKRPKAFAPEFSSLMSDPLPCVHAIGTRFAAIFTNSIRRIARATGLRAALPRGAAVLPCALALASATALGSTTGDPDAFPLPEITVTARTIQAPPTLLVRDVDADDLYARNANTVGEALAPVPGLNVQYGGTSGDARAWIRGFRDRDALVLFDGIPIASGFEGTIDLNEISTEHVDRIRVMKSAPSVIYGSNGLGGVIDVLPSRPMGVPGSRAGVELGSDGRRTLRGSIGGGDAVHYRVSVSHERADDYSLSGDYQAEISQRADRRSNSDFQRGTLFLSLSRPTEGLGDTLFFASLSDAEKGLPPTSHASSPAWERLTQSQRRTLGLSHRFAAAPISAKIYYNSYDSELATFADAALDRVTGTERSQDSAWGAKLYSTIDTSDRNSLVLYAARQTDSFETDGDELGTRNAAQLTTWTAALEDQFWIRDSLSLAVGAIYTYFDQTMIDVASGALNPQVALGWQPTRTMRMHASAAERTRFPKLRELYRQRYGNTALREQSARNVEVGISVQPSEKFGADVSLFRSDIEDMIERPDRRSRYLNLAPVRIEGVELSSTLEPVTGLQTRLSWTFVDAQESLPDGTRRQLRSRPRNTTTVELRWRLPRGMQASMQVSQISGLHDLDERDRYVKLPDYLLANLKLSATLGRGISGYLAVSNALDANYLHRLGDPRDGRALRLGVDARL